MKKFQLLLPAFLLVTILLSACGLFASAEVPSPTPSIDMLSTSIVQTLSVQSTQIPSDATIPAGTLAPFSTEAPAEVLTSLPNNPQVTTCDIGTFVADVTIPDGTVLPAGSPFIKTWRILNSGTCSWDTGYQLVFSSGNSLSATPTVNLPDTINPGQSLDISVNMVAPNTSGTFKGFWLLRNDSGNVFGVGTHGNIPVSVVIVVGSPNPIFTGTPQPSSFAITHVGMSVNSSSANVSCPSGYKFTFTANIESNSAGQVSYYWDLSNGSKTAERTINFTDAGTKAVALNWTLGSNGVESSNPYQAWARIYIDKPNHQFFSKQNIRLTCQ